MVSGCTECMSCVRNARERTVLDEEETYHYAFARDEAVMPKDNANDVLTVVGVEGIVGLLYLSV